MRLIQYFLSILLGESLVACEKDPVFPEDHYYFQQSFADSSGTHPKGSHYQVLLDVFIRTGVPGVSVMINDEYGTWLGAGGFTDLKSKVVMQPGNQFQIASISKVFTAACIFTFVDEGLLSLDDRVIKWIDASIIDKVDNSGEAKIRNLLEHTSGIKDYYTTEFEMERYNKARNVWIQEDVLAYIYGKKADFELDKYDGYSNTSFLLLGMILEKVSGKSMKEVYEDANGRASGK